MPSVRRRGTQASQRVRTFGLKASGRGLHGTVGLGLRPRACRKAARAAGWRRSSAGCARQRPRQRQAADEQAGDGQGSGPRGGRGRRQRLNPGAGSVSRSVSTKRRSSSARSWSRGRPIAVRAFERDALFARENDAKGIRSPVARFVQMRNSLSARTPCPPGWASAAFGIAMSSVRRKRRRTRFRIRSLSDRARPTTWRSRPCVVIGLGRKSRRYRMGGG